MPDTKRHATTNELTRKPGLLITGAPRSGTTWAGKVFASVSRTLYVHEPFNPTSPCAYSPVRLPEFFYRIDEKGNARELKLMEQLVDVQIRRCSVKLSDARHPKILLSRMKMCATGLLGRIDAQRVVIKDPIAILSADILCKNMNIKPLFMVRDPAACVSSLYIRNWRTDFTPMLKQRDRLESLLPGEMDRLQHLVENPDHDLIDNAAFLWRISNQAIIRYIKQNPDWSITRHEELIKDPISAFKALFEQLDFPWTDHTRSFIENLNTTTPGEPDGSGISSNEDPESRNRRKDIPQIFNIQRDLNRIRTVAKERLKESQLNRIQELTQDVFEEISMLSRGRD
ncbi:MAG: sulfotransferase [Phycisphaerales bacterium]|nr:sulfotransferase [Phycisphaerales bacterium]